MGVRKACKHGTVVLQCKCPEKHDIQIVGCPSRCPERIKNEEIDAAIADRVVSLNFGDILLAKGQTIVVGEGNEIWMKHPDGTSELVGSINTEDNDD